MFKARVRDFQSIEDADIEVEGFTVITGPNNSGKSALMRALRGAFQNTRGTGFVRHKKPKSTVEIEFADKTLSWSKGKAKKAKPTYVINGGDPIYPGQQVPDEVKDLGVKPIQAGGREIWPQFAPQFTGQLFLLDQPGSVLAEAVADVERVSQLNQALKLSESDRRKAGSTLKVRMSDRHDLQEDLKKFDGLDELDKETHSIEDGLKKVQMVKNAIEGLTDLRDNLNLATGVVDSLKGIEDVEIPPEGDIKTLNDNLRDLEDLRTIHNRHKEASSRMNHLCGIEDVKIPQENEPGSLGEILNELDEMTSLRDQHKATKDRVEKLSGIEDVEVELDITQVSRFLEALGILQDLHARYTAAIQRVHKLEEGLAKKQAELDKAASELEEYLAVLGECPLCGSDVGVCDEH